MLAAIDRQRYTAWRTILLVAGLSPPLGWGWWLSCLCAIGAVFSMALGALIGFASFSIIIIQIIVGVRRQRLDYVAAA